MKRYSWLAASALVLVVSATPLLAQDAKETLHAIPSDALGFVYTGRVEQGNEKLQALAKQLKTPLPGSPLDLAKNALGVSKGLNVKGSAAVVFFAAEKTEKPVPVLMIPVSNYKEFLAQFEGKEAAGIREITMAGKKMVIAKKGKHAIITEAAHRDTLKNFLAAKENLAVWSEPIQAWLNDNDLAVVVTTPGIKHLAAHGHAAIAKGKAEIAKMNKDLKELNKLVPTLDALDGMLKTIESDVTHAGLAVKLDKVGNVHLDVRTLYKKDSKLAKNAAGLKALAGGPLAGLPKEAFALAAGGPISAKLFQAWMDFGVQAMKQMAKDAGKEIPKEKLEKLQKNASEMMQGVRGMGLVIGAGKEGETLFDGITVVMKVDDAAAFLDRYEKKFPEFQAFNKEFPGLYGDRAPGIKNLEMKRVKNGKKEILELTLEFALPAKMTDNPMQKKIMEAMYGPGRKITVSMAATDPTTVTIIYRDAEAMKKILMAKKAGGLNNDPNVAATLALLPKGSACVLLVDPKGTLDFVKRWVKAIGPKEQPAIPAFPQTPPVGVGVRVSETGLVIHAVLPAQIVEAIGKLVAVKKPKEL